MSNKLTRTNYDSDAVLPGGLLRVLYSLTMITMIFPFGVMGSSGWIGLATGGGMLRGPFTILFWLMFAAILYRVYLVGRYRTTLVSYRAGVFVRGLRWIAIAIMVFGCLIAIAVFFQKQIVAAVVKTHSDDGIEYFIFGLIATVLGSFGSSGVFLFELTRLIGVEKKYREDMDDEDEILESNQRSSMIDSAHSLRAAPRPENRKALMLYCAGVLASVMLSTHALIVSGIQRHGFGSQWWFSLYGTFTVLLAVYRLVTVARNLNGIPRYPSGNAIGTLRWIAICLLPIPIVSAAVLAVAATGSNVMMFGSSWITGIAALLSTTLLPLLMLFDLSRLLGFEKSERNAAKQFSR